jgi:four helix bundle protein
MESQGGKRKYDLAERLTEYALLILEIVEKLPNTRLGGHVAGQLIRCGTSPAGNYAEAQAADSRLDFVHKLKIVLKELRESRFWLTIILRKALVGPPERVQNALTETDELIDIFVKSIGTAKRNLEK